MSKISIITGERLRRRRQELKYSQETVAEKANLHPTYIGQIERGEKNATIESIEKICIALNYPLESLFSKIILSDAADKIANQCYDLIINQPLKDQMKIQEILKCIIEYKKY